MSTENQTVESNTLGDLFRETRETKGLTVQQVSDYLFITPSIITAIEENNRPSNINEVFWRGYIRSYAKYLDIETQQLQVFYSEPEQMDLDTVQKMRDYSQREVRRKQIKWLIGLTSGIVLVLLIIFVLWWHEHNLKTLNNALGSTITQPTTLSDTPITDSNGMPVVEPQSQNDNSTISHVNNTVDNNSASADTTNSEPTSPVSNTIVQSDSSQGSSTIEKRSQSMANNSNVNSSDNQTPKSKVSIDTPALQINFSGDCWIKVTDSNTQKVLYAGLQSAGNQLTFQQSIGYDLVIGAPAATRVIYDGKPVDLTTYSANNKVAKFSLSPNN